MSYIKNRIAKDRAQDPLFRAAYDEEIGLIAKETALRQNLMAAVSELRKAQRLSQQQLAAKLQVSQARVSQMERATESLSLDSVLQMVEALNGAVVILSQEEIANHDLQNRPCVRGAVIGRKAGEASTKNPTGKETTKSAVRTGQSVEHEPVLRRSQRSKRVSAA